jgi:hypothetical protein
MTVPMTTLATVHSSPITVPSSSRFEDVVVARRAIPANVNVGADANPPTASTPTAQPLRARLPERSDPRPVI